MERQLLDEKHSWLGNLRLHCNGRRLLCSIAADIITKTDRAHERLRHQAQGSVHWLRQVFGLGVLPGQPGEAMSSWGLRYRRTSAQFQHTTKMQSPQTWHLEDPCSQVPIRRLSRDDAVRTQLYLLPLAPVTVGSVWVWPRGVGR